VLIFVRNMGFIHESMDFLQWEETRYRYEKTASCQPPEARLNNWAGSCNTFCVHVQL
jgi:hypothetical protein